MDLLKNEYKLLLCCVCYGHIQRHPSGQFKETWHTSRFTPPPLCQAEIIILINRLWGFSKISISPFDILKTNEMRNKESRKKKSWWSGEPLYHTLAVNTGRKVHPSSSLLLNSKHILTTLFIFPSFFIKFLQLRSFLRFSLPFSASWKPFQSNIMLAWTKIISK